MENENFVNRAFNDCSEKIKKLAKILFCIGLVAGVITAIGLFNVASNTWGDGTLFIVLGIASIIVVPLLTWISCIFLYGFGELIEKVVSIDKKTKCEESSSFEAEPSTIKKHSQNFTKVQQEDYEIGHNPNADEIISQTQSIVDSNNALSNAQKKKYNKSVSLLNSQLKLDIITEEEYQKQCAEIRSKL